MLTCQAQSSQIMLPAGKTYGQTSFSTVFYRNFCFILHGLYIFTHSTSQGQVCVRLILVSAVCLSVDLYLLVSMKVVCLAQHNHFICENWFFIRIVWKSGVVHEFLDLLLQFYFTPYFVYLFYTLPDMLFWSRNSIL